MIEQSLTHPPRFTSQRRLVWDVLQDAHEHLDAEAVYLRAKARSPKISLATVYRSLAFLKCAGLVQELSLGENHSHYEPAQTAPHEHFTCLGCGKVVELELSQIHELADQVCAKHGLHVLQLDLHLSGYCQSCAPQKARP